MKNIMSAIALILLLLGANITEARDVNPTSDNTQIVVNLSKQRLVVYRQGLPVFETTISSGKPGFETPEGMTTVINKEVNGYSKTYKCPTPYMLELGFKDKNGTLRGIRIHEGIVYKNTYPASHACIRVPKGNAKKVFDLCPVGTQVTTEGNIFDYLDDNFDGFNLLKMSNNELVFKLNLDGSLTNEFIQAVKSHKLQVCQIDPATGKKTSDKTKWKIGWQFIKIENCIPVPKYERQVQESVYVISP